MVCNLKWNTDGMHAHGICVYQNAIWLEDGIHDTICDWSLGAASKLPEISQKCKNS